jgi:hypothetical protein
MAQRHVWSYWQLSKLSVLLKRLPQPEAQQVHQHLQKKIRLLQKVIV